MELELFRFYLYGADVIKTMLEALPGVMLSDFGTVTVAIERREGDINTKD